jgi:hypothetical protein
MIDPLAGRVVAAAFALLLLLAAWHKVAAREQFVAALGEYRLLPEALWRPAALLIPACEAALGVAWLIGAGPVLVPILTATLLAAYAAAMAVNLWRGRVHIGCGCGLGSVAGEDAPLSWWLVLRNLLLGTAAMVAALPPSSRELDTVDWLTLAFALLASVLLYAGASQLTKNGAAIAAWRKPRD